MDRNNWVPLALVVVNIVGAIASNAISIVLARNLTHGQFEIYVGTIATLGLVASLGELGIGKYALRVLPAWLEQQNASQVCDFRLFAIRSAFVASLVFGVVLLAAEYFIQSWAAERSLFIGILFLPFLIGSGVASDFVAATGRSLASTFVVRILMPIITLAAASTFIAWQWRAATWSVAAFGLGSLLGTACLALLFERSLQPERSPKNRCEGSTIRSEWHKWLRASVTFLALHFTISALFRIPLVLLYHVHHSPNELALLAPAFETAGLILLLSKSTDKYYLPTMSTIIDRNDWIRGREFRNRRYATIGIGVLVFLAFVALLGKPYLSLYGADFKASYGALIWATIGCCVWTVFSLAPSFLLFVGKTRPLMLNAVAHLMAMCAGTVAAFPYGVTATAIAFAAIIVSFCLCNLAMVNLHLASVQRNATLPS